MSTFTITITIFVSFMIFNQLVNGHKLLELFSWSKMDFFYPSMEMKKEALLTDQFIPENSLPVGIEVWADKLFVTVPRWRPG